MRQMILPGVELRETAATFTGTCVRRIQMMMVCGIGLWRSHGESDSEAHSIPHVSPQMECAEPRFFHCESSHRRNGARTRLASPTNLPYICGEAALCYAMAHE